MTKSTDCLIKRNDETGEIILSNSVIECWDIIEKLYEKMPDRRTKDYKKWRDEINRVIEHSNNIQNFKAYNKIK